MSQQFYLMYVYDIFYCFNLNKYLTNNSTIVGITLFANLITLTIFLEAIPITLIDKYKYDWSSSGSCCRKIAYLFACLYPLMWAAGLVLLYIYWDFARLMAWYLLWQWVGIIGIAFIVLITIWIIIFIQKKIREKRDREYYARLNQQQYNYEPFPYYGNDIEYGFNRINQPLIPFPPPQIPENRPLNLADSILAISEPANTNDQNLDGLKRLFKDPDDEGLIDSEDINVIDDNNDRQNLNDINRRRTLADIFLESRQNLRPRLASF